MNRRNFLKLMFASASLIALYRLSASIQLPSYNNQNPNANGLTPFASWYVVQIGKTPTLSLKNYVLTVDGDVENPLKLTYDQLVSMPSVTIKDTIQCVSDPDFLRANVEWTGVPLKYILNLAKPNQNAIKVLTFGAEGYTADLPMWKAMEDDTLVAYMVDGQPLPLVHGYPVRMVVPRWWGYTYTKWLVRIHVTSKNVLGYWESLGYPDVARKD